MSTPVTPTAARKRTFSQVPTSGDNNESSTGWWGAIGGVVGEFLQGWGLFGVLRKRTGGPGGARSTPATPPMYSHPSSPTHEHIELRQLNFQRSQDNYTWVRCNQLQVANRSISTFMCREDGDGSEAGISSVLTSCVGVQRRHHPSNHPQSRRAPRHSYYEGSTPDSYLLTAVLIHSLKHGSGKACQEPHCQICVSGGNDSFGDHGISSFGDSQSEVEDSYLASDSECTDIQVNVPEQRYGRSVSQDGNEAKNWKELENRCLSLSSNNQGMPQVSPLSSPSNSFQYAQISPLSSPHSSVAPSSTMTSSLNPTSSLTSGDSSMPLLESELSSLDISSLTDITMSSSLLSGSALSLHQADCLLGMDSNMTSSELSLATTADCGTLVGSFSSETNVSDTISSETFPCDTFPKHLTSNTMSSSVHSLPSRLTLKDRASPSLLRPVLLSTGSLVLLPRRPSLVSPPSVSSASSHGHFMWEENPCYVRVEGSRPGEGHVFRPTTLERPAWCDACAHLVFYHAITCHNCNFTCHEQCQDLVTLDCKTDLTPDSHTSEEDLYVDTDPGTLIRHESISITVTSQEDEVEELEEDGQEEQEEKHEEEQQEKELLEEPCKKNEEISTLRKSVNRLQSHLVDNETLEAWVEKYNATSQGLQIAKENDGSYRGCIRVHLNLSRPINIVAGTRPPSIYDILQEDRTMEKTLTSFYMPRDAVKAIHITSKTTTREVIIALLRKFKVVDNPQKFALYERTYDIGQAGKAKLRRLGDSECPLVLAINWSAEKLTNKRLVLQENDTADIQWEAFSLPELSNFLRILDREEEEYRCQIKDKYALLRRRIDNILIQSSAE